MEDGVEFEVIGNPDELRKAQEMAKIDAEFGEAVSNSSGEISLWQLVQQNCG